MKGLPLAYQKDMQEDKEAVFDSFENIVLCIQATTNIVKGIIANKDNMKNSLKKGFPNATDLADYLVKKLDIPFRDAHNITGLIVKMAESKNLGLEELSLKEMQEFCPSIKEDIFEYIKLENSLNLRKSYGGTAIENVKKMIEYYKYEI